MKKRLTPKHFLFFTMLGLLEYQGISHAQAQYLYGAERAEQINLYARGVFYICLNSFKEKSKADRYYSLLHRKGFKSALIKYNNGFYRVYIGPLYSAAEVRKMGHLLKQSLNKDLTQQASSVRRITKHQSPAQSQATHSENLMNNTYYGTHEEDFNMPQNIHPNKVRQLETPREEDFNVSQLTQPNEVHQLKASNYVSSFSLSVGGFYSSLGHEQTINIEHVIGEEYTKTHTNNGNGLIGLSYYIKNDEYVPNNGELLFGINANYFGKTSVSGDILQEMIFKNLSYSFNVEHIPVYATVKTIFFTPDKDYSITADAGIGPNFMLTSGYNEKIIYPDSLRDNPFSGQTTTTLSAMLGIGLKRNHLLGEFPLECGYHFYYLGQGKLLVNSSQILNQLNTGQIYANALTCSISN